MRNNGVILVVDVGNTNVVFGFYQHGKLLKTFRKATDINCEKEKWLLFLDDCFSNLKLSVGELEKTVIASVVPPLSPILRQGILELTGKDCHLVNSKNIPGLRLDVQYPEKVGVDRLVNAYQAYQQFHCALVVVDLGTATNFDVVSGEGIFLGGAIAPGLKLSYDALVAQAEQLPAIDLVVPPSVIGKNTIECMQSGIIFGYAGMIDSMINRISQEMGETIQVIVTGGLARFIEPVASTIDHRIDDLTLRGLYSLSQAFSET
ncbi:MAG: pantothenate kinase [SAR324 cluster bacterium]|uniref:Type III pantothenate kinase n=1 Tax=SAR324 cluster bacterium TaxID=2024889 RepID=A0A2A4TBJ5_9DELT|nr:MAG: pantothenate kinase [SAR324 cluster bacterium]